MATRRVFVTTAAAAAILARPDLVSAADPKPLAEVPADKPIRVGMLVFPRMDQIDLTGPFAVLSRLPNATVKLLWKTIDSIRDYRGLGLIPDAKLSDAGEIDLLVVPGGPGQEDLMEDETVLSLIIKRAEAATCVFSVCTGALVCGARRAVEREEGHHTLGVGAVPEVFRGHRRRRAGRGGRETGERGGAHRRD